MSRFDGGTRLRYGYVTNGLVGHRLEDALRLLADCGYDGVALTLDHVHFDPDAPLMSSRAASLRSLLDELGLACVVETGARFALDPRRKHFPTLLTEGRGKRVRMLSRAVDVAAELGAPVVSMWSGAAPSNISPNAAWERLLEGVDRVAGARRPARRAARLRARAGHVRRAAGRLRGARSPPRPSAGAGADARHRPLRLPRAAAGRRSACTAPPRGSCTCTSRTCVAGYTST